MALATKILTVIVVGTLLGVFAVWITVFHGGMPGGIANGPWKTNTAIGSPQSDPLTRASIAIHGLFALNRTETIYYTATSDDQGAALDGRCRYQIAGRDPDARWWSITAYGTDDYLIPNPGNLYSVAKTTVARSTDGSFVVDVGGTGGGRNWIPAGSGGFSLTLRLYNPGPTATLDPGNAILPSFRKVSCP